MSKQNFCHYCGDEMDFGQEFVFLVEAQNYEERVAPLELVQSSPHYHGEPLRICKECRASIEENRRDIEVETAREQARSQRYRRVLALLGVVVLVILLGAIIADLSR